LPRAIPSTFDGPVDRVLWPRGGRHRAYAFAVPSLVALLLLAGPVAAGAASPDRSPEQLGPTAPLRLVANATPSSGELPLTVEFAAEVQGGNPIELTVSWTFGDGTTGTGLRVQHQYATSGNFSVRVSALDGFGDTGNTSLTVRVADDGPNANPGGGSSNDLPISEALLLFAGGLGSGVAAVVVAVLVVRMRGRPEVQRTGAPLEQDAMLTGPEPLAEPPGTPAFNGAVEPGTAAAPPGPTKAVPAPRGERRRASEQVILHLETLGPLRPEIVAEEERSQAGIGRVLGLPQNVVSPVLRRLVAAGVLTVALRHVRGRSRRLKVYALTPTGLSLAHDLQRRLAARGTSVGPFGPPDPGPTPWAGPRS
jgi:hypothetical protein